MRKFFGVILLLLCAGYSFALARALLVHFVLGLPLPHLTTIVVSLVIFAIISGYFGLRLIKRPKQGAAREG